MLIATGVEPAESRAGTDRERADAGRGVYCAHTGRAESYGCAAGHRRLWHRLFQLYLSAAFSGGRAEAAINLSCRRSRRTPGMRPLSAP